MVFDEYLPKPRQTNRSENLWCYYFSWISFLDIIEAKMDSILEGRWFPSGISERMFSFLFFSKSFTKSCGAVGLSFDLVIRVEDLADKRKICEEWYKNNFIFCTLTTIQSAPVTVNPRLSSLLVLSTEGRIREGSGDTSDIIFRKRTTVLIGESAG